MVIKRFDKEALLKDNGMACQVDMGVIVVVLVDDVVTIDDILNLTATIKRNCSAGQRAHPVSLGRVFRLVQSERMNLRRRDQTYFGGGGGQ